ncbi:hypothetical protein IHE77_02275 [Serratia ureilytica]|uniref:Uncharacterized protein n=1 Tax=Serratia marcescens TaxID=615 RepID=A0A656VPI8_SERMA|nr:MULTISPECIES: hypothetical protein [Serratia]KMU54214.1 hypothetical protein AB868_00122 [Serratia marcescens]MBF4186325.1 hypothetical protein [Serratia ureilytica]MBF8438548.1 hypothetical protein [Serratia ureilytica]MBF8444189.1 hypothetical protein [Serratia ureilytica]NMU42993.1 hypothetical protein [Serratia marcescens]
MDINELESKERFQSHTFVLFPYGTPYTYLGWNNYRKFNKILNEYLSNSGKELKNKFYIHEHEVINFDKCFVWIISFFEKDINKQKEISAHLILSLKKLIDAFYCEYSHNIIIANNKDSNFNELLECINTLDLHEHYLSLISFGEEDINLKDTKKPKKKSFEMPLPDLNSFEGELNVGDFVKKIDDYLYKTEIQEQHQMIFAPDGYWSTKYPALKLLREEFIPLKYFIKEFNISDEDTIHLGFERLTYDACFTSFDKTTKKIVEITAAIPKEDHLLLSLYEQSFSLKFPVKNQHKLKMYKDSVPGTIIKAIDKKHEKNYLPGRILIVTLPLEYIYQGEEYIIDEIINEVSHNCTRGIGGFSKILLLCNGKFKTIFSHERLISEAN